MVYLIFFLSFAVYLATLCPTISVGDSPELITASYILGVPHAPGYPLYCLLGKVFTVIIPWGNPAYKINLMSAFFASSTVCLVYRIFQFFSEAFPSPHAGEGRVRGKLFFSPMNCHACRQAGATTTIPLVLAFSSIFWSQAVVSEVFILNTFFAVLILWIATKNIVRGDVRTEQCYAPTNSDDKSSHYSGPKSPHYERQVLSLQQKIYLIFFLLGLGLGNHHTLIFILPAIFLFWYRKKELYKFSNILFFFFGFSVYFYLLIRAQKNPAINFGDPDNFAKLVAVILRQQFGTFALHPSALSFYSGKAILKHCYHYFGELIQQFSLLGFGLGVLGAVVSFRDKKKYFFPFLITFLCSGLFFILWSNLSPNPMAFWRLERFYLLPNVIFIFWIFWGVSYLAQFNRLFYYLPLLIVIFLVQKNFTIVDRRQHYLIGDLGENILRTPKKQSVIILDTYLFDEIGSSPAYWMLVGKKRPDLTVYCRSGTMFNSLGELSTLYEDEGLIYLQEHEKHLIKSSASPVYYATIDMQRLPPDFKYSLKGLMYEVLTPHPFDLAQGRPNPLPQGEREFISKIYQQHFSTIPSDYMERLAALHYPYFQGKFYLQINDKEKAKEYFRQAENLGQDMEWLFYNLGVIWTRQGDHSLARLFYQKSMQIDPYFSDAYFGLGSLEYQEKNNSAARQYLEEAVCLRPSFAPAHYNLGIVYEESQLPWLAIQEWNKFIALEPNAHLSAVLKEKIKQSYSKSF